LPIANVDPAVGPSVFSVAMFEAVLVLSFVGLEQFVVLVVPVTFASAGHFASSPAALVLVVYADQRAETLHEVGLEAAFVDCAVSILDSAFAVAGILVKISFIDRAVLVAGSALTGEEAVDPDTSEFSFGGLLFVSAFSIGFVAFPLSFVAISVG
jgi:hypothetical protein